MARSEAGEMIRFQEVLAGIQERMAVVAVRTMMARHRREREAVAVVAETPMPARPVMELAAAAALPMETAAAAAAAGVIPVDQVELEEPVERLPTRIPAAVVGMEEMIMPLVKS